MRGSEQSVQTNGFCLCSVKSMVFEPTRSQGQEGKRSGSRRIRMDDGMGAQTVPSASLVVGTLGSWPDGDPLQFLAPREHVSVQVPA